MLKQFANNKLVSKQLNTRTCWQGACLDIMVCSGLLIVSWQTTDTEIGLTLLQAQTLLPVIIVAVVALEEAALTCNENFQQKKCGNVKRAYHTHRKGWRCSKIITRNVLRITGAASYDQTSEDTILVGPHDGPWMPASLNIPTKPFSVSVCKYVYVHLYAGINQPLAL